MKQPANLTDEDWILPLPQYRMRRLQMHNWGTFSGLHDIPIAIDGFLFIGRSGSGKSTLLDALSALLVPPVLLNFNAAARDSDKGKHDRNLPSYIRGAWADQEDARSGEIVTQYLRPNATWSALALEYLNDSGQIVSLIQLFWLRGNSNRSADVRRHFMITDRPFNIASELKEFDLDLRKLKNELGDDVYHFDKFRRYSERFRRLLGIESEMALKLLHKTQSAKNLGDLNEFLRDFMLDKPKTFEVSERLVDEFSELDAAHQAVVTVRDQVNILKPAHHHYQQKQKLDDELKDLNELIEGIDTYHNRYRKQLLDKEIEQLHTQDMGLEGQEKSQKEILDNHKSQLNSLQEEHHDQGGGQIERCEHDKERKIQERDKCLEKRAQAESACKQLKCGLPNTPQAHAELIVEAKSIAENWKEDTDRTDTRRDELRDQNKETETEFLTVRNEIDAMQRQPSNIPFYMLELRKNIADSLDLTETDLPFVGELIEVKQHESNWEGAIERVLHGFALSILVDEEYYASVSRYVNETRFNKRLVYYRVIPHAFQPRNPIPHNSLVNKLNLKQTSYKEWLTNELARRFDYTCVDSIKDFRKAERAITREGQVRHGKSRHEKDDRFAIDDRSKWVLGFDNLDKLKLYTKQAQTLATEISRLDSALKKLVEEKKMQQENYKAAFTLVNLHWQDIDIAGILDRIHVLEEQLNELRNGNLELKELGERIEKIKQKITELDSSLTKTKAKRIEINGKLTSYKEELENIELQIAGSFLTEQQESGLDNRFVEIRKEITLKNLENQCKLIERGLNKEKYDFEQEDHRLVTAIEKCFSDFTRQWPVDAANFDSTMASANEFIALLKRLEKDGLPEYEERFFDLLKDQSTENLAALNKYMTQARKEIRERMELVNESLSNAEFNPGTHLLIEVSDRHLPDVKEFRDSVNELLKDAWHIDRETAESRFTLLRELVNKLASQENEHHRWREQVLDVRQHVEFIGREYDSDGKGLDVYRSGAGKSGGQREKLTTTCLAAALRYQLGGTEDEIPVYAPVVLDEAFGKADNEFTELAMNIFTNFGFQMIVATPLKSVMTLEPFIGGACFVDIADRKHSSTLQIEYDQPNRRLNLPEKTRGEVISS